MSTVASLDSAPLRFNALLLESTFVSRATLVASVAAHYRAQIISEAYKVVGSADVLGNPVGLFASISTGVTDFFYDPAEGITIRPRALSRVRRRLAAVSPLARCRC